MTHTSTRGERGHYRKGRTRTATGLVGAVLTGAVLAVAQAASAADTLPRSSAADINESGTVVGEVHVPPTPDCTEDILRGVVCVHAFMHRDGVTTDLGTLGGPSSRALAVNERGQVTGAAETATAHPNRPGQFVVRAFLFADGQLTALGTLGGPDSFANGLNDAGVVVGGAALADGRLHAFRWRAGQMSDLGTLGGPNSTAFAVNNGGQVVGEASTAGLARHAFMHTDGRMVDLGTLGGRNSRALDVNENGVVVGQAQTASGQTHAFVWRDGQMTDLGTLGGPFSRARSINAAGVIVGDSVDARGRLRAFVLRDGQLTDLGTFGGDAATGRSIADNGVIVGDADTTDTATDGLPVWHAYRFDRTGMTDLQIAP